MEYEIAVGYMGASIRVAILSLDGDEVVETFLYDDMPLSSAMVKMAHEGWDFKGEVYNRLVWQREVDMSGMQEV